MSWRCSDLVSDNRYSGAIYFPFFSENFFYIRGSQNLGEKMEITQQCIFHFFSENISYIRGSQNLGEKMET